MNVLVIGGNGGIGGALTQALSQREEVEFLRATWHRREPTGLPGRVDWHALDVTDEESIASCWTMERPLDCLIYAAGFLHGKEHLPEKTIRRFDPGTFRRSMEINVLPVLSLAGHLHDAFKRSPGPQLAAISARVGSIEENRRGGWYSYRSSKAALNMALKTLALEWRVSLPRGSVAALHPGTTDTALSAPFQRGVAPEKLFTPAFTASKLLAVIDGLTPANSGRFWSWDGTELPW